MPVSDPRAIDPELRAAVAFQDAGRHADAVDSYRRLLEKSPGNPLLLHLLGLAEREAGDFVGAVQTLRQAAAVAPEDPDPLCSLGAVLGEAGQIDEAETILSAAVDLAPGRGEPHVHLGDLFFNLGRYAEGAEHYRQAWERNPALEVAWSGWGTCLEWMGRFEEGLAAFRQGVAANPQGVECRSRLAMALLRAERFQSGWMEWAWRLGLREYAPFFVDMPPDFPLWSGEPLAGKRILLLWEPGGAVNLLGLRMVHHLRAHHAVTILAGAGVWSTLAARSTGIDQMVDRVASAIPDCDYYIPMMSLPGLFGVGIDQVAEPASCLRPDAKVSWHWRQRLEGDGFKVGVAFTPDEPVDAAYETLLKGLSGLSVYLLNKPQGLPVGILGRDLGVGMESPEDMAAIMDHLDLVITWDEEVAHLAGSLGRPVWHLLRKVPDWCWGRGGGQGFWYPGMKLFGLNEGGERRVLLLKAELAGLVAEHAVSRGMDAVTEVLVQGAWDHFESGNLEQARKGVRAVLAGEPGQPEANHLMGLILLQQGEPTQARGHIATALQAQPDHPLRLCAMAEVEEAMGNEGTACAYLQRAVQSEPDNADALTELGRLTFLSGDFPKAKSLLEQALATDPDALLAHFNLAVLHQEERRFEAAIASFGRVLQSMPEHAPSHVGRAFCQLTMGDFANGWPGYEWRGVLSGLSERRFSGERWDGFPLDGRCIYVYGEQGFGDLLLFSRYLPLLKEKGAARVILECKGALAALLQSSGLADEIVSPQAVGETVATDCHIPLLSLPGLFSTTVETIPARLPYIIPPPERVAGWRGRLGEGFKVGVGEGFKVGLVWSGNPKAAANRFRACTLRDMLPLLSVSGVQWFSLQMDSPAQELAELPQGNIIRDLGSEINDFADTAAILSQLDLLISTDTAVVHLAGAMGAPVWTLLHSAAEWRWLDGREDSPWYPGMRLYRQKTPRHWGEVMTRVAQDLSGLVAG